MDEPFDLLTLALLELPPVRAARARGRGLSDVLARPDDHAEVLPAAAREALRSGEAFRRAEREAGRCRENGVAVVALCDARYPPLLRELFDPPPVLFVQGDIGVLVSSPMLAVVGTRAASNRGRSFARTVSAQLASAGVAIVSGLARGIDAAAHQGALDAGGFTIGVLGSGLDRFYPPENRLLARSMLARGAVVSEFPLETPPHPGRFPQRNRIIAGFAQGVVVVEAPLRSGALVTARLANEAGREVMAVPGPPEHPSSSGTNELLRDGATLVRHAADVALSLNLSIDPVRVSPTPGRGCALRSVLAGGPLGVDEISEKTGLDGPSLLRRLAELELLGVVERLPGARYGLCRPGVPARGLGWGQG